MRWKTLAVIFVSDLKKNSHGDIFPVDDKGMSRCMLCHFDMSMERWSKYVGICSLMDSHVCGGVSRVTLKIFFFAGGCIIAHVA